MIANALTFITKLLNGYLKNRFSSDMAFAELAPVTSQSAQGRLLLSLIEIEETPVRKPIGRTTEDDHLNTSSLSLNLDLLVSVSPQTPYVEGMKILSQAMTYFQGNPVFTSKTTGELPKGIHKITLEMIPANTKPDLWLSLGADYQPSVMYKIRVLLEETDTIKKVIPEIRDSEISSE